MDINSGPLNTEEKWNQSRIVNDLRQFFTYTSLSQTRFTQETHNFELVYQILMRLIHGVVT